MPAKKDKKNNLAMQVLIISIVIFAILLVGSLKGRFLVPVDNWVYQWNLSMPKPTIPLVMMLISGIMNPGGAMFLGLLALIALIGLKRHRQATMLILAMVVGYLATEIFKAILQRPRPDIRLAYVTGFSFPSGHATMAAIYFGMLILLFKDDFKNTIAKYFFIAACA
ncbi:phosphatase PAP2 family protein, partial [Candidatus Woesearchaeota archaeon]|nr:phosphatase PAP2 family protein [Candidatus Woesearchaeota archaeon]